jgi:hypothetical protein
VCATVRVRVRPSSAACVRACSIADQSLLPLPPLLLSKLLLLLLHAAAASANITHELNRVG